MALIKGTNSYVTVGEANLYFENKLDVAAWTEAPELEKEKALMSATQIIDESLWVGVAVSADQLLAFPRYGEYFEPRLNVTTVMSGTVVPLRVLNAVCEQAYHMLNNDGLFDSTGDVKMLSVGSISLSDIRAPGKISPLAKKMISPLLGNSGSRAWWRSN